MKINLSLIISSIVTIIGLAAGKGQLWLPMSVLIASLIAMKTSQWVASDQVGEAYTVSIILKFLLSLIGTYAALGQFICLFWLIRWFA